MSETTENPTDWALGQMHMWRAYIKRLSELHLEELDVEIARWSDMDRTEQTYLPAWWAALATHKPMKKIEFPLKDEAACKEAWNQMCHVFGWHEDLKDDIERTIEWRKRQLGAAFEKSVRETIESHQITSPIEQLFVVEWKYLQIEFRHGLTLKPQSSIKTERNEYTVDFLVSKQDESLRLVIELDGHEFHERTKEQARNDRQRERALVAKDLRVIRFTGSEVFRETRKCVLEVVNIVTELTR